MGTARAEFESAFREALGVTGARAVGKGRQAIYVLLKALGVGTGDRVGVTAYTCLAAVEPVLLAGATPVYLDIDRHAAIDPGALAALAPGSLKVVILQHTWGVPGRLQDLLNECRRINAAIIEDCVHAFGSTWNGMPLGRFGDGAIFSLGWSKPLPAGTGGILTINSAARLDRVDATLDSVAQEPGFLRSCCVEVERRVHRGAAKAKAGLQLKLLHIRLQKLGLARDTFEVRGPNYLPPRYVQRMDDRTARAGLKLLADWPRTRDRRREGAEFIRKRLAERQWPPWPVPDEANVTLFEYPMLAAGKQALVAEGRRRGLDVHGWYDTPINPVPRESWSAVGYEAGRCPEGERLSRELLHVPTDSPALEASLQFLIDRLVGADP